jgi:hypothetical protein
MASSAGVALLVTAAVVGSARPAVADIFSLETNISINTGCNPTIQPLPNPGGCLTDDDPVDIELWGPFPGGGNSQGAGLLVLPETTYGPAGEQLTASAASNAAFGSLQATATASYDLTGSPSPAYRFIGASAQSIDTFTPTSVSQNGLPGFLDMIFALSGTVTNVTGSANAGGLIFIEADVPLLPEFAQGFTSFASASQNLEVRVPIVYGQPLTLSLFLGAAVGTIGPCPDPQNCEAGVAFVPQNDTGSGTANFFNSLVLTGLLPLDQSLALVTDAQFSSSASGTQYTVNGVVPEPGTLLLLGSGLAIGCLRLRRRNR